jgi:hypothetical protein
MRRILAVSAFVAAAVVFVLAPAAPSFGVTKAELHSKLLSLSDMPTGWSVDNSGGGAASGATGCLKAIEAQPKLPKGLERARVSYTDGNLPSFGETLEAGKGAVARYDKFLRTLEGCTTFGVDIDGTTVTGSMGAMSFPTVGESSSAFAARLTVKGITVGFDIILFRGGAVDGELLYADISPDPATVQAFATAAVRKIEGLPVTAPVSPTAE